MKFTGASLPRGQAPNATLGALLRCIRNRTMFVTVAIAAGGVLCAGCGGGGDDVGSTSAEVSTAATPTIAESTQPATPAPNGGAVPTTPKAPDSNPANGARSGNRPPGALSQQNLSDFRDCLRQRGVHLRGLRGGSQGQRNPERYQAQVEKAFTCIPKLPPQLRETAEQLQRRFEQRQRSTPDSG